MQINLGDLYQNNFELKNSSCRNTQDDVFA